MISVPLFVVLGLWVLFDSAGHAAKHTRRDQREILSGSRPDQTKKTDIAEHDDIADYHCRERIFKTHSENQNGSCHRAGDDHRKPDPDHHVRKQAQAPRIRDRSMFVFRAENVICTQFKFFEGARSWM
jgi:hypothetical protein